MASEEVMVAQNQGIGQKITQVAILLQTQKEATITAINLAIPAAINLVEMLKHRVKGLYQINSFERVENSMKTRLKIKLSFNPLNVADKGYQAPVPEDQVTEKSLDDLKKPPVRTARPGEETQTDRPQTDRPRGRRNRRSRGYFNKRADDDNKGEAENETRGGGRRFRRYDRGTRGERRGRYGYRPRGDKEDAGNRGEKDETTDRGDRGSSGYRGQRGERGNRDFRGGRDNRGDGGNTWGSENRAGRDEGYGNRRRARGIRGRGEPPRRVSNRAMRGAVTGSSNEYNRAADPGWEGVN